MRKALSVAVLLAGLVSLGSGGPEAAPPPSGPVSEWKFDGNGLNEVGGMWNAVAHGNAEFRTSGGVDGGYAHVPGDTDWIQINSHPDYNLPTSFTVEFWFRQFAYQSFNQTLVTKGDSYYGTNYHVYRALKDAYNHGIVKAYYKGVDSLYHHASNQNYPAHGRWHHVVYTKNATGHAYYLDGDLVSHPSDTVDAETNSEPIIVGDTAVDTDFDELRIYDRYMTAQEVSTRYKSFPVCARQPCPGPATLLLD